MTHTSKRDVLYLIDGSGYIFRAFYAIRHLTTRDGVPTNAVIGFAKMLMKLLHDATPAFLGIAFDTPEKNFRHTLYADYKANRQAPPENLIPQFALIQTLVAAMDIPVLLSPGFEADDVLATLAKQAVMCGMDVMIVSGDKDLMQLVDDNVTLFDPMKNAYYNRAAVIERFGVPPEHVVDILALAGDSSDNIPGVPSVGPKSAAKLIQTFGDTEAIIAGLMLQTKRKAAEEAVLQHAEQARLSKRLAHLSTQAPVALDMQALRYTQPNPEKLVPFLRTIEAYGLLREFTPAPAEAAKPATPYRTLLNIQDVQAMADKITQAGACSVDLETTSLEATQADIVGIALCVPGDHDAVYIPVAHRYIGAPKQLALHDVLGCLRGVLENRSIAKFGQHLKYDWLVFARAHVHLQGIAHDAMLASYVLDPARQSHGLDALAKTFLGHENIAYSDITGTGKQRIPFDEVAIDVATPYAAEDADIALRLCQHLEPLLIAQGMQALYTNIEIPLIEVLARMEHHGILVDTTLLNKLSHEFQARLLEIENQAYNIIGRPVNLASPKQLSALFFEELGYPVIKKTKTGLSTDQEVLEILAQQFALPQIILEHRMLSKLKSTYIDNLVSIARATGNRIHTSFNQTGTATGRLSSTNPNLQNIPIRSEDGKRIRAAFIAPQDWCIVSADYSQIELRIMAHMSEDANFIRAFINNEDIHLRTAQEIFGHLQTDAQELRRRAKAINFGIMYGLSEFGLAKQLGISRFDAQNYIQRYFARYPRISQFLHDTIETGSKQGFVSTITGRRRYLPDLQSNNKTIRQAAERIAMNTPIQGSAADLIKIAMINVHQKLQHQQLQAHLLLQVHDELVFEVANTDVQACIKMIRDEMTRVLTLRVPIVVDIHHGSNWALAHS